MTTYVGGLYDVCISSIFAEVSNWWKRKYVAADADVSVRQRIFVVGIEVKYYMFIPYCVG